MQVTNVEKITWEFSEPADFPCFACNSNRATLFMTIRKQDVLDCKFPVCNDCKQASEVYGIEQLWKQLT